MKELNTQEGLKIISAELENFQALEHKLVEIQGKSIVIIGKNGGSKSALLRAIQSPLNSKIIPAKAIKDGEDSAYVKLKLKGIVPGDDYEKEFTYRIDFNAKNQKGKITVTDDEGKEIKTRGIQKDIIGDVSFDVDQFIRLGVTNSGSKSAAGVREQVEILRQFLTKEEKTTLNALDLEYKERFEERTDINRDIKALEVHLKEFNQFSEQDLEKYAEDKSDELRKIQEAIDNIGGYVVKYERAIQAEESLTNFINEAELELEMKTIISDFVRAVEEKGIDPNNCSTKLERLVDDMMVENERLAILEQDLETNKLKLTKTKAWLSKNVKPDTESLKSKRDNLKLHQEKFNLIEEFQGKFQKKQDKEAEANKITDRLAKIQQEKKDVFSNSTMPVKGLTFDDDGVYYKDLPFDGDHHPSSHIISVGVKLAMAMNPNLRCVFIKDGSLFDKKTFAAVLKFIEFSGYQLFIEMVDWNADDSVSVEYAEEFIK